MPFQLALVALAGPLALLLAAGVAHGQPGPRPVLALAASAAATVTAVAVAAACIAVLAVWGPQTSAILGIGTIGLSVRLDALSMTMYALVSFVGLIVVRFSRNYLDGDPRQGRFLGDLCLTLAAVSLLVLAGNLVQLAGAWIATSLALHRLLVFYPDRPRAIVAARKKFLTARLGDVCLVGALVLLFHAFGSSDIATILGAARDAEGPGGTASIAAVLIAVAAVLKSAQFPTQGWLTEVMETPTPVSALLHAGIVNAGGFLVVRFADVMLLYAPALHLLAAVGALTAVVAALVATTQTSVKVGLAWSTVAQMGFMLMQCGFGAFALAVLHLVAHSAYKAHAFLSSGTVVENATGRSASRTASTPAAAAGSLLVAAVVVAVVVVASSGTGGYAAPVLAAIFALGLLTPTVPLWSAATTAAGVTLAAASVAGLTAIYLAMHAGTVALMGSSLPMRTLEGSTGATIAVVSIAAFSLVGLLHLLGAPRFARRAADSAYVHLANGLYANAAFNRLAGAFSSAGGRN